MKKGKWMSDEIVMKAFFIGSTNIAIVNELANEHFPTPKFHSMPP